MNDAELIRGMPSAEYHGMDRISQSGIKLFLKDPGQYEERHVLKIPRTETPKHFIWGQDFEDLIFEDTLPGVVIPEDVLSRSERDGKVILRRAGPAWREFETRMKAEHGDDVRLLKSDEWEKSVQPLLLARDQLRANDKAAKLVEGDRHTVALWEDEETGLPCKCQFDIVSNRGCLVDLKTAADATPDQFNRAVFNFGYNMQAAWYSKAWERATGERLPFAFVVVQSSPSYFCEVYTLADEWMELANNKIATGLRRLAAALESGKFETETCGRVVELRPLPWMTK